MAFYYPRGSFQPSANAWGSSQKSACRSMPRRYISSRYLKVIVISTFPFLFQTIGIFTLNTDLAEWQLSIWIFDILKHTRIQDIKVHFRIKDDVVLMEVIMQPIVNRFEQVAHCPRIHNSGNGARGID